MTIPAFLDYLHGYSAMLGGYSAVYYSGLSNRKLAIHAKILQPKTGNYSFG